MILKIHCPIFIYVDVIPRLLAPHAVRYAFHSLLILFEFLWSVLRYYWIHSHWVPLRSYFPNRFNRELARLARIYTPCNLFHCNVYVMCLHVPWILLWDVGFFFQRVCGCWVPTLRRIILEVGNYEFSFSQLLGVLDKWWSSNRKRIILWYVKLDLQGNNQTFT